MILQNISNQNIFTRILKKLKAFYLKNKISLKYVHKNIKQKFNIFMHFYNIGNLWEILYKWFVYFLYEFYEIKLTHRTDNK